MCASLNPWLKFPKAYVMVGLMFNKLRRGVIGEFADIGEIVDHPCLKFPIKTWSEKPKINRRIYNDISKPWNIGHHSISDNDTSKCIVDIYSLILMM